MKKVVKNIMGVIVVSPVVAVMGWLLWSFLSGGGLVIGVVAIITGIVSLVNGEK